MPSGSAGNGSLQISDRFGFGFDGAAAARKSPAAVALRDKAPDARLAGRDQQDVGSACPQLVAARERLIEMPEVGSSFAAVKLDCFAEPVIGRAFARPVGSQ
jgi:hypothetical protein